MLEMKAVQNHIVYNVHFRYDPQLVGIIRQVPGREFIVDKKYWTIPVDKLGFLQNIVERSGLDIHLEIYSDEHLGENASIDETTKIPDIDISDVDHYVESGSHLFNHQIDFLKYAKAKAGSGFILADMMGLGKTAEIINYALYRRKVDHIKHCLVICCVNSAKYSWRDDIKKHTNGAEIGYILGCRKKRNGDLRYSQSGEDKLKDLMTGHMYGTLFTGKNQESTPELPFFIIMNIEAVRYKSGKESMKKQLIQMIKDGEIGMIALDEIHKNASPTSEQGKAIKMIKEKTGAAAQWIPMTGTPIVNKPTDVFLPLLLVDGHDINSFYKWQDYFCVYGDYGRSDVICYKNIPILKDMLQGHMIRRTKESVLDLPDKVFYTEYVENTAYQTRLYTQVQSGMVKRKGEILSTMNPLAEFIRLRQVNGCPEVIDEDITYDNTYVYRNAKLKRLLEIVDEIIERDEKVVIFSNWVQALKPVYHFLQQKYKVCCFTGTMSDEAREKHKRVFCNNPNYKIMIGTIGALGTAQTLTVANNVILYDEPWNAATRDQAIDRCHRISATKNVNIYTLLSAGTIDEIVHDIIFDKECTSQYIVDGKLDIRKNPDLFDMLLGK